MQQLMSEVTHVKSLRLKLFLTTSESMTMTLLSNIMGGTEFWYCPDFWRIWPINLSNRKCWYIEERKGWIKYIFPYGRISDFNTVWTGTTVVRLLQFFFRVRWMLSFAWLALLSISLNFPCFKVHFCTLSLCEANSKEWIMFQFFTRISFLQERLQIETLMLARARIHIWKLGPNHPELKGLLCLF